VGVPCDFWSCADLQGDIQTALMQLSAGDADEFLAGEGDARVRAGAVVVDRQPDGASDRASNADDQERNSDVGPAFGATPLTGSQTLTFGGGQTDHCGRDLSPETLTLAISAGSPARS
jgi:hypothetical protein